MWLLKKQANLKSFFDEAKLKIRRTDSDTKLSDKSIYLIKALHDSCVEVSK